MGATNCDGWGLRKIWARSVARRGLGEPEIEHLHRTVECDLDVRRLEIAMNDAFLVRRLERFGNLTRDRDGFADAQWASNFRGRTSGLVVAFILHLFIGTARRR